MKKILLIGIGVVISTTSFSQIFTDNFDSYVAGQDLVTQNSIDWDTWSGGSGTTQDVAVSNSNASSGSNSLYFSSSLPSGGPEDIILRFAQVYTSGIFTLESNFYVEAGKGAYFNLQQDFTVGGVWAIDCFMLDDGTFKLSNSGTAYLTTTYPIGQWFNMRIEIDLTSNSWELFINNVAQGSFSNPVNSIGILDLYPTNPTAQGGNGISGFYVDDVSYNHIPASLPPVNGGVTFVNPLGGIAGQSANVDCTVRNLGSNTITSFDIEYTYAGNPTVQESVGPISLSSLASYNHVFATPAILAAGSLPLTVTISNVNGAGVDGNTSDDSKSITINPIVPAPGKVVLGEEATGSWCGWCPRGAVNMEYMEDTYPDVWAGVAVHNNDPMVDATYDAGLNTLVSGYPSLVVDRGPDNDPSAAEQAFLQQVVIAPTAYLSNGATYNSSTRELKVSVSADFQMGASGDWRVGVILTEDSVVGTSAGYNQVNYYAGGANGVMGGYETLANPVPASQMVYDHVGRTIAPSFEGLANSFPTTIASGTLYSNCFTFILPASWDDTKIHVISFLKNPSGGIDNAAKETISSAVTNGYVPCATSVSDFSKSENFKLFPNPANGITFIDIIDNNEAVNVKIMDLNGRIVTERDYNDRGTVRLPILTNGLDKGIYIVTLTIGDSIQQQKLVVQ